MVCEPAPSQGCLCAAVIPAAGPEGLPPPTVRALCSPGFPDDALLAAVTGRDLLHKEGIYSPQSDNAIVSKLNAEPEYFHLLHI